MWSLPRTDRVVGAPARDSWAIRLNERVCLTEENAPRVWKVCVYVCLIHIATPRLIITAINSAECECVVHIVCTFARQQPESDKILSHSHLLRAKGDPSMLENVSMICASVCA